MRKFVSILMIMSFLSACSTSSKNVAAQYISPLQYQHYDCDQIRMEMSRISRRVNEVGGIQDSSSTKDAVALGVGLVIFWPALFFMIGKDKQEELSRLKGEYEAVEVAAIEKKCNVVKEVEAAKKMEEERKEEQKKYQKETGQPND